MSLAKRRMTLGDLAADLGLVDIGQIVRKMRAITPTRANMFVELAQAKRILAEASNHVDELPSVGNAQEIARSAIARAQGGITYHEDYMNADHSEPYVKASDLKNRVAESFEAYNMVAEGVASAQESRAQILGDVWQAIKDLPETIGGAIGAVVGSIAGGATKGFFSSLFDNPWALVLIGGAGFVGYQILKGKVRRVLG